MDSRLGLVLKAKGISASELARGLGKSRGYISDLVNGFRKPSFDTMAAIEGFLSTPASQMFLPLVYTESERRCG
jgi:transcriptional regulator with XRE-family HTH domain